MSGSIERIVPIFTASLLLHGDHVAAVKVSEFDEILPALAYIFDNHMGVDLVSALKESGYTDDVINPLLDSWVPENNHAQYEALVKALLPVVVHVDRA